MKIPEAQALLNQCNEIEFENHLITLSDNAEEVLERQKRSRTNRACVYRNIQDNCSLFSSESTRRRTSYPSNISGLVFLRWICEKMFRR